MRWTDCSICRGLGARFAWNTQPRAVEARIEWPDKAIWQTPKELGPVFAGDTLHVFASFGTQITDGAKLILRLDDGREVTQSIDLNKSTEQWDALPRIAAADRIENLDAENSTLAKELANNYQLVTKHTNFLILDVREEDKKAQDLPQLAQVRQMLAAGWGGTSTVMENCIDIPMFSRSSSPAVLRKGRAQYADMSGDMPSFLRRLQVGETADKPYMVGALTGKIIDLFRPARSRRLKVSLKSCEIISMVSKAGYQWLTVFLNKVLPRLPNSIQETFQDMVTQEGWSEQEIAAAILFVIASGLGIQHPNDVLGEEFTKVQKSQSLVTFIKAGIRVNDGKVDWSNAFDCLPSKEEVATC